MRRYAAVLFDLEGTLIDSASGRLVAGMDVALQALHREGVQLAVATSKPEVSARRIVQDFGIAPYFAIVAGTTFDQRRRYKDEVILHALEHLSLPDPATVVMVGDRGHDVL